MSAAGSDSTDVVIVGAGIAGLTAALALARAGLRSIVVERAPELAEIGAGLQLSSNAGRCLAALGLDAEIAVAATAPAAIEMRSGPSGRTIVSVPLGERAERRYGTAYRVIHRADLQQILRAAVEANEAITLRLGEAFEGVETGRDGVTVKTANRTIAAKLLVGADGVWSSVRAAVEGASAPVPSGRTAWRATIPTAGAPAALPADRTTLWLGRAAHLVTYPVRSGTEFNLVAIVEEGGTGASWNEPADPRTLVKRFAAWSPAARSIIAAPKGWQKWPLVAVDPMGRWVHGRVALIGDAAHAMLPFLAQGAAMAIEDAAVLASELKRGGADVEDALHRYQAIRGPRVARVWRTARGNGSLYHMGSAAAAIRNIGMIALGGRSLLGQLDWLYGWEPPAA